MGAKSKINLSCHLLVPGAKADALGSCSEGIASEQTANSLDQQLGVIKWISWYNCLVQVLSQMSSSGRSQTRTSPQMPLWQGWICKSMHQLCILQQKHSDYEACAG